MRRLKRNVIIGLTVVLLLSLVSVNGVIAAQETKTIVLGHPVELSHPYHYGSVRFAELIKEKTDGRYEIKIYPARQLGQDRELWESLRMGTLDMAMTAWGNAGAFTNAADALQLPWLIPTEYDFQRVLQQSDVMRKLADGVEQDCNVKILSVCFGGVRHLCNNIKPITNIKDLKGLKFRVMEVPLHVEIFKALGVNPVPIPYGDIYMALKTNVVDGHEHNISGILAMKFYEVTKYLTLSSHFTFPCAIVMNNKLWSSLSVEDQKIFQECALEAQSYQLGVEEAQEKEGIDFMLSQGVIVNKITDLEPYKKLVAPVIEEWKKKDPRIAEFVTGLEALKETMK
jgi:tripartite ATP-independent transporter DctP family solute receptor